MIAQILSGKTTLQLGNLSPTRDLVFVKDTVQGFIEIFNAPGLYGEATNIGMNAEIAIKDLVMLIGNMMGVAIAIVSEPERIRPTKSEVERLKCDNAKILSQTAWKPSYTLQSGLAETITWMKNNRAIYQAERYHV